MIAKLSNTELNANLKRLVSSERKILHLILEHINEVDSRKLYLEMAYSSLYEYLTKECQYSGSAAMRRISAAHLIREVPVIAEKIQTGTINLSQIGELARAIKEKEKSGVSVSASQKNKLVAMISGKTTSETQKEISVGLDLEIKVPEKQFVQKDNSVRVELTLTQEQYQRLMKCRDIAAPILFSEGGGTSIAEVVGLLTDFYLKSKKRDGVSEDLTEMIAKPMSESANKTLTPKTRREIFQRDKCCQYKDPSTGRLCGSTFDLEIDHVKPRWASGDHSSANLQVLCRAHNNFKYQRQANLRCEFI